jgi:hypothetical protein
VGRPLLSYRGCCDGQVFSAAAGGCAGTAQRGTPFVANCTACAVDTYAATPGQSACSACPAETTTAGQIGSCVPTACRCRAFTYSLGTACRACPEGAECHGGDQLPVAKAGYWIIHAHARPKMCIAEFHALVTDAALLDEVEHDSKFSVEEHRGLGQQDVRLASAEAQMDADMTVSELSEMLFCEFIEALARIALQKWGHRDDIGDKEKIGFAVDAVTRLLSEIKRGGATIVPVAQRRRKSAA